MPRRTRSPWRDGMHTYAILVVSLLGLVACPQRPPADPSALRGVTLPTPIERPAFRLQDTEGQPYDFADRTKGRLTFLFFGYTNCPDVCPVHMSNLATVLRALDYTQRQQVAVVFVTADPERDSPAVLRKWLDSFDPSFVGLWGSEAEVDSVQKMTMGRMRWGMQGRLSCSKLTTQPALCTPLELDKQIGHTTFRYYLQHQLHHLPAHNSDSFLQQCVDRF
jgi:cytochrome oxidase Cu insertion factor (SCO1/SenC/PrrC family)